MIVNILKASPTVSRPLGYNEEKVGRGVAQTLAAFNVDGTSPEMIAKTFTRYEARNRRTQDSSFHMNINPLKGQDNMTDEDIVRFANCIMKELGYGSQPYVIYRHDDIERTHYHVVSIRTDENGKKIRDRQEQNRCKAIIYRLQSEFDYRVGNASKKKFRSPEVVFDSRKGNVTAQMRTVFDYCLKYNFTSIEQLRLILRLAHIDLQVRSDKNNSFILQGLDFRFKPCTRPITEKQAGFGFYAAYEARAMECVNRMKVMKREREHICGCARGPLKDATSELHFRNMMRKNGIDVRFERDPETRKITGGNFVDHVTRCAFRLSELGTDLELEKVREADGRWPHRQPTRHSRALNLAGEMLLGMVSGDGSRSRGHDQKDETDLEREERLEQQSL